LFLPDPKNFFKLAPNDVLRVAWDGDDFPDVSPISTGVPYATDVGNKAGDTPSDSVPEGRERCGEGGLNKDDVDELALIGGRGDLLLLADDVVCAYLGSR
jgi:hypothetical protein